MALHQNTRSPLTTHVSLLLAAAVLAGCDARQAAPTSPSGGGAPTASLIPADGLVLTATMVFGQSHTGSPFPPAADHDESANATDNLVPRLVVIDQGGTVTFDVPAGAHQIAIYSPGTEPGDIDLSLLTRLCPGTAPRLINDPRNRIALITSACGSAWQAQYTFDTPGRYLVICAFLPHFQVGMYGWVEVRERS